MADKNGFKEEEFNTNDDDSDFSNLEEGEFDITSSPNDFNVKTIYDFMISEVVEVPNFQRNYVWDHCCPK